MVVIPEKVLAAFKFSVPVPDLVRPTGLPLSAMTEEMVTVLLVPVMATNSLPDPALSVPPERVFVELATASKPPVPRVKTLPLLMVTVELPANFRVLMMEVGKFVSGLAFKLTLSDGCQSAGFVSA